MARTKKRTGNNRAIGSTLSKGCYGRTEERNPQENTAG